MKLISWLCFYVWLADAGLYGQEVPPAFEMRAEEIAEEADDMIDPFDPTVYAPKLVRVQVEYIELAHKDLTRVMMEDKSETADATALRFIVQEMVEQDKAKILDTQMVIARSGQKSTSESRSEHIYPTEYELPTIDEKLLKNPEKVTFSTILANPTAFETRNLGSSLEIEPTIGEDDRTVDLRLLPSLTWLTGETIWSEYKDALGNVHKVSMPEFYALDINTSLTCVAGQYCLLGVLSPKDGKGRMDTERKVMVFVKSVVLPAIP